MVALLSTIVLSAQTMAFTAVEVRVKEHTQKDIEEAFDKVFEGVKMKQGGSSIGTYLEWTNQRNDSQTRMDVHPRS